MKYRKLNNTIANILAAIAYPIAILGVIVWLIKKTFMTGYKHFQEENGG